MPEQNEDPASHDFGNDWRSGQYENDQFATPSRSHGRCLLIGCAAIFIGGIFLILCAGFGGYRFYMQQVEKYTSTEPMELPVVEYDDERFNELETRIAEFKGHIESIDAEKASSEEDSPEKTVADQTAKKSLTLRLSADDINALITHEEDLKQRLFVRIENDQVMGDLSFPLDDIIPAGEGRFFNGSATFDIRLEEGDVFIGVKDIQLNGEALPSQFVDELEQQNFAEELMNDPQVGDWLKQFERVKVEDDELVIEVKRVASEASSD